MKKEPLLYGKSPLYFDSKEVDLKTVFIKDESYFKIENYDEMPPFFMTVVSDSDFWLFVSSTGGLSAGRQSPETALFPYYTDDKIHDSHGTTGPHTLIWVSDGEKCSLWKPFSAHQPNVYAYERNLYKSTIGNQIIFEEVNRDLNLTFRYSWKTSQKYGLIKTAELVNHSSSALKIKILDGIRNLLPYGVDSLLQSTRSTLVDGYKRNELYETYGIGVFTLSSIISDKAEPSESLKATTVWARGLESPVYLLSEEQILNFERNLVVKTEHDVKGKRGAFYLVAEMELNAADEKEWLMVSELNQSAAKIEKLMKEMHNEDDLLKNLKMDISLGSNNLKKLVYDADGFQKTADEKMTYRHFSNVLYNIMRGGVYANGYEIQKADLLKFVEGWNKEIFEKHQVALNELANEMNYFDLLASEVVKTDPHLKRLILEYLPLTYSRRHGDPSRPWNKYSIDVIKENGERNLNFEGNWRDIFQNWEALSLSFPGYIQSIITKFVNASTADGYNPYRITKSGVDWELLDPSDPWSNIGYWGDHQIIYLLKLMELFKQYDPKSFFRQLNQEHFVYANVPYRIKGIDELIKNPRDTIIFDDDLEKSIKAKVEAYGSDGKLIFLDESPYTVSLWEKILVVLLSKLSNYVPKGGIWLNTQRPEWNDANNALVGSGVSMVTLYYLHRFLIFMSEIVDELDRDVSLSVEVLDQFEGIFNIFKDERYGQIDLIDDQVRYNMVYQLGQVGEKYRQIIYGSGFSGDKKNLKKEDLKTFVDTVLSHVRKTIGLNKREDGLYHAYNLLKFKGERCELSSLYEMLEGQVAVLSSKALSHEESLEVMEVLRKSSIYREDQNSYMLYPMRELPKFLEKNIISESNVLRSKVFKNELEIGSKRIIEKDVNGKYRFNGKYRNAHEMTEDLLRLNLYSEEDICLAGEIFTEVFDHHSFTGRSGTFYKYEGLGCIYWHMVSKLVLASYESFLTAVNDQAKLETIQSLACLYHELKEGIGLEKSPLVYGAFPTDAYSHTPSFAGVQQPGMTGQVKEDIISRFGELGVNVVHGELVFNPKLLSKKEFLKSEVSWHLPTGELILKEKQLGFTLCSVPIIYELDNHQDITVYYKNGDKFNFEDAAKLNQEMSRSLFMREGKILKIHVKLNKTLNN